MRSFQVSVPDDDIADLRRRLADTRWPNETPGGDWERGTSLSYLKDLAEYWRTLYDWRAVEAEINSFPQFVTEIDGLDVHFLHIRSGEKDATPLVLTHGWPGAVTDFLPIIGPLSDPTSHGGRAEDAFDVVIPSLPGYGFSGPVNEVGWDIPRVARAWGELMGRLGYDRYVMHGGDLGSFVSLEAARLRPGQVAGVHLTQVVALPTGDPAELAALDADDQARLGALQRFDQELSPYLKLHATRPKTVSYGLNDSPVGQLAWIAERFQDWTAAVKNPEDVVSRDALLTTASIYWFTATATSSAQLYYESAPYLGSVFTPGGAPWPPEVPVGVAVFPDDIARPVRTLAERDLPAIVHWTELDRGGHFPALEQPELLVDDLRGFARAVS